jgi:hypothetical protein
MKVLLFLFPALFTAISYGQSVDSLYMVTYTTGPLWDSAKKPQEQTYFKEHSANLSALRKSAAIRFGARYAEKGIILISAKSLLDAKAIIQADVAVINKLFNADIQKLNVFYPWKEQP